MTLLNSFHIGLRGLLAQSKRLEVYTKNIANADTPNYKRQIPILTPAEDISFKALLARAKENVFSSGIKSSVPGAVDMPGVILDPTPGEKVYMPGHPDADENGYVTMSNVTILNEMADATMTTKAYEAILSIMSLTKQMGQKATEIGRG
ncbi:MAG: flagellar basal body protein [Cyanobacteriota bacterium]